MSRLGALLLVWLCHMLLAEGQEKVSVAVIGAGIGGSAASYFLREALDDDLQTKIVVFDSATKIGGRTAVSRGTARWPGAVYTIAGKTTLSAAALVFACSNLHCYVHATFCESR